MWNMLREGIADQRFITNFMVTSRMWKVRWAYSTIDRHGTSLYTKRSRGSLVLCYIIGMSY